MSNVEVGIGGRVFVNSKGKYDLEERLLDFAVLACRIAEGLPARRVGNHVAGQLIRAATSPAPNYGEAQSAESRRDFIHKMRICLKELRETLVWLKFIKRMDLDKTGKIDTRHTRM